MTSDLSAFTTQMNVMCAAYSARETAWLPHDRRGRWVVIEPGAGRYLTGSPRDVRRYVDAASQRRGRRFSSLSRARAFAKSVEGTVARWRRTPPGGGVWRQVSPWDRIRSMARGGLVARWVSEGSDDEAAKQGVV